ncbi:MAG TPA: pantoate--beta-alanine ligase, partial [Polyangiaceae bacterium]|nr:pantoate--beta-alanine ligase [Polyangiaceae bacterium]
EAAGMRVDYVELATPEELEPISDGSTVGERALLALAAFMGKTRLIDNVVLGEDPPPIQETEG